jgi:hypothetical protein
MLFCNCVQQYVSPYKSPPTSYLVVEGFISGNTETQYRLTRSIELPGDSVLPQVTGAKLQVEGSDSSVYPLPELGQGEYGGNTLNLSIPVRYRLRIATPDGQTCLSDFVPLKPSPPIQQKGNIHNVTNPDEQVIGYISAGTLQQQRIFIYHDQLPYWIYNFQCYNPDIAVKPDSIRYYFGQLGFTPVGYSTGIYLANETSCVDCTSQGGSNQKPAFWPN